MPESSVDVARYDIRCANCGDQEVIVPMSEASACMPCPLCARPRPQVFSVPNFTEDRTRFWKGPMGNGYSTALGEYMPESKRERDALAKKKGVEFCSLAELTSDNKEAQAALEYHAHVQAGGAREERPVTTAAPWQATPSWAKDLV